MWFVLPARSSEPANLVNTALISLAGLPAGESPHSCKRPSSARRAGPCHLPTARTPAAQAALPPASLSDSKAWPASLSRSCLLIAVHQKVLNMSIKRVEEGRAKKDLALTTTHFLLDWWLSSCLTVVLDEWAGHFPTHTTNTANRLPSLLFTLLSATLLLPTTCFLPLQKGLSLELLHVFIRGETPKHTHGHHESSSLVSFHSPLQSFSYYIPLT